MSNGIADLWKNIRGKADDPSLGYVGASMLPGIGEATDLVEIGAGLQDRSPGRVGLGIAGLMLPFVGAAGLSKLFRGTRKLPMDKASRMKRAKKMGFDTPLFHGTYKDPKKVYPAFRYLPDAKKTPTVKYPGGAEDWVHLEPSKVGMEGPGTYLSTPNMASIYAEGIHRGGEGMPRIYPVMVRSKKLLKINSPDYKKIKNKLVRKMSRKPKRNFMEKYELESRNAAANWERRFETRLAKDVEKAGYEGMYTGDLTGKVPPGYAEEVGSELAEFASAPNVVIFNPKNMRSTSAKFDPRKRHSPDLLAGIAGLTAARQASNALREDLEEAQIGPSA